jgi:dihydrodipicolinate synthase/N-acetylneuraminate lyase
VSQPLTGGHAALTGLIPVLATPFTKAGDIAVSDFVTGIERAAAAGSNGVMFPGFASEFHKLEPEERVELEDAMLESVARFPEIISVVSIPDHATVIATRRVERAVAAGAQALNVLPPFFLAPAASEVVAHLDVVLDAAGRTPVMLQYAPNQTGGGFPIELITELAQRHENLVAVKVESNPPGRTISALRTSNSGIATLVGYAGLHLIDALRRGAVGVQPGGSFPELYRAILDHWSLGDSAAAERLHGELLPYLSYWMTDVELIVQVEKRIAHERGWFSTDQCRSPRRVLDAEELRTVDRFMRQFEGFLA